MRRTLDTLGEAQEAGYGEELTVHIFTRDRRDAAGGSRLVVTRDGRRASRTKDMLASGRRR